jgi:glycine hydroxymethyltransferase
MSYLQYYLSAVPKEEQDEGVIASLAGLDHVSKAFPVIGKTIVQELLDQRRFLKLIASENYSSLAVQLSMGNWLTDKYSEGYVGHRFYAGCDNVDVIEGTAISLVKEIFGADHAYVQPHSGADANLVAYFSILMKKVQNRELEMIQKKSVDELTPEEYEIIRQELSRQKIMGMSLASGGHLTHGYRHNISSKIMQACSYEVDPSTGVLDYAQIQALVKKEKPLILLAGYSAYSRLIDFAKMREIADSVGAVLMVDMAHFAGLVAGKVMTGNYNPVPFADIVTSTTHKTLRGPRGGLILCKEEFKEVIDKGCPLVLGGPLPHVMAAKAIAFKEANTPEFCTYARQIVKNAQALAKKLISLGVEILTGGTDNHLVLLNVEKSFSLNGRQCENALRKACFTVNRNAIFQDKNGPWYTSGIRLGSPALTTLGMKEAEMEKIASLLVDVLKNTKPLTKSEGEVDIQILHRVQKEITELLQKFPVYPEIVLDPALK